MQVNESDSEVNFDIFRTDDVVIDVGLAIRIQTATLSGSAQGRFLTGHLRVDFFYLFIYFLGGGGRYL